MVSLIIPVLNESECLPKLLKRLQSLSISKDLEIIIQDDSYDDHTKTSVEPFKENLNLKFIHHKIRQGLSASVINGFDLAQSDVLICIDGDGSHPVEKIEELATRIKNGESMVVASRHVQGAGITKKWNPARRFISDFCCWLASPLTDLQDPMSGFFAISSDYYKQVRSKVKPISYKIALELAVKGNLCSIVEIPYTFEKRLAGSSKVNGKVILGMAVHLIRLYIFRIFHHWLPMPKLHTNSLILPTLFF